MPRTMWNNPLNVALAAVVVPVMSRLRPWTTRGSVGAEKEENTMHCSTRKTAMTGVLCVVAVALGCFSTGQAYAETSITIVNNLGQSLVFKDIKNRQAIQIKSDPPAEIPAHSSGQFKVAQGDSMKNVHLNVEYTVKGTADEAGIVYKHLTDNPPECPQEPPAGATETVKNCGNWDTGWTYTFAPK